MAGSSPLAKKRRRYYKHRLRDMKNYNRKWTNFFKNKYGFYKTGFNENDYIGDTNQNFLAWDEYQDDAWRRAELQAQSSLTWYQSLFSGHAGYTWIAFVVVLVITIVITIFSCGSGTAATVPLWSVVFGVGATAAAWINAGIAMVALTAATIASFSSSYFNTKAEGFAGLNALTSIKVGVRQAVNDDAEKSNAQITNLIIYSAYAIYPQGVIFKKGRAGSETFCFDTAYDYTRGMRGDLAEEDIITETIHSRVGADLAGGVNFHQKLMQIDFPLKQWSEDLQMKIQMFFNRYRNIMNDLAEAMVELANLNIIGARSGNSTSFERIYYRLKEKLTKAVKYKCQSEDFLYRIKNYNRDLRADFNFLNQNFWKVKEKPTKSENLTNALLAFNNIDELWASEKISLDRKADLYINYLMDIMLLLDMYLTSEIRVFFYNKGSLVLNGDDGYQKADNYIAITLKNESFIYEKNPYYYKSEWGEGIRWNKYTADEIKNIFGESRFFCQSIDKIAKHYKSIYYQDKQIYYEEVESLEEFHILDDYFYKTTNRKFSGDEIINLYNEFLKSLYLIGNSVYFVFFEDYYCKTSYYNGLINHLAILLNDETRNFFTADYITKLREPPEVLKDFDFSTLSFQVNNTDDDDKD